MASLADGMWCVLVRNQSLGALELGIALSTYTPSTVMTAREPVVLKKKFPNPIYFSAQNIKRSQAKQHSPLITIAPFVFAKVLSGSERKERFTLMKLASLFNFVNSYCIKRPEDFITGSARILHPLKMFSFKVVFHTTNPV